MRFTLRLAIWMVWLLAIPLAMQWSTTPDPASARASLAGRAAGATATLQGGRAHPGLRLGGQVSEVTSIRWLADGAPTPALACDDDDDDGDDDADSLAGPRVPGFDADDAPDLRTPHAAFPPVPLSATHGVDLDPARGAAGGHSRATERPPRA